MNKKVYAIDIDGTICTNTNGDYINSIPFQKNIEKINKLYDDGNTVIYYTARGMKSTNNSISGAYAKYYTLTENQLKEWGAKYHQLILGKIYYDIIVDDKAINDKEFFEYFGLDTPKESK